MLPRAFYEAYGLPRVRTVFTEAQIIPVVDFNADRYLLVFIATEVAIRVRPIAPDNTAQQSFLAEQGRQLIFTHALHGSLTNMAWEAYEEGFTNNPLTVIEGYMVPTAQEVIRREMQKPIVRARDNPFYGQPQGYSLRRPNIYRR